MHIIFKHSPMGPGFWSVFAVRSKGSQGPKLSSCGHRRLWSAWADAQADPSLRWAHIVCFVVHRGLPSPLPLPMSTNAKRPRRIFPVYYLGRLWYQSILHSEKIKSIAYLENKYWTDRCHSACKSELLFCRKLRLQWLCTFKLVTVHLQR